MRKCLDLEIFSQFLLSYMFRNLTYNPCCNYYYTCLRIFITKLKMAFSEVTLKFEVPKKHFVSVKYYIHLTSTS